MSGEDYQDSSLEGLIKIFKKLTSNETLARNLEAFKRERNFLSYEAITSCLVEGDLLTRRCLVTRTACCKHCFLSIEIYI